MSLYLQTYKLSCRDELRRRVSLFCQSQWLRILRHGSTAAGSLGNAGSKPAGGMVVSCGCCVSLGTELCDSPITRQEESYRVCVVSECDRITSKRRPKPTRAVEPWQEKILLFSLHTLYVRHSLMLSCVAVIVMNETYFVWRSSFGKVVAIRMEKARENFL